jgi:TonB family protein
LAKWYRDLLDEELIAAWQGAARANLPDVMGPLADARVAWAVVEFSWRQRRQATFNPAYEPMLENLMYRYPDSAKPFLDDLLGATATGQPAFDLSQPEAEAVCRILLDLPDIRTWRKGALQILPHYRQEAMKLLDRDLHGSDQEKMYRATRWLADLNAVDSAFDTQGGTAAAPTRINPTPSGRASGAEVANLSAAQNTAAYPAGSLSGPSTLAASGAPRATLIHEYRFNGNANDSVGSANGALMNGAAATAGVLTLNGANQYVRFASDIVPTSGSYSVALFAQEPTPVSNFVEFISQGRSGGPGFYIGHTPSPQTIRASDSWTTTRVTLPGDGHWHCYVLVVDATALQSRLFVDGIQRAALASAIATTPTGTNTRLGRQFDPSAEYFKGSLADVQIYTGVLSGAEIVKLSAGSVVSTLTSQVPAIDGPGTIAKQEGASAAVNQSGDAASDSQSAAADQAPAPWLPGTARPDGIYKTGNGVSAPVVISKRDPEYSDTARKMRAEGVVVSAIVVQPDGTASDFRVTGSMGYGLDEQAIEAIRKWRFKPAMKDGKTVPVLVTVETRFTLHQEHRSDTWYSGPMTFPLDASLKPAVVRDGTMPKPGKEISNESVVLEFTVDANGVVKNVHSIQGSESASNLLAGYLATWKFQPAAKGDRTVEETGNVHFIKGQGDDASKPPLAPGVILAPLDPDTVDDRSRSLNSNIPVVIDFVNRSGRAVDVYWINYQGNRRLFKANLAPGAAFSEPTYVTHPWLIVASGTGGTTVRDTGIRLMGFEAVPPSGSSDPARRQAAIITSANAASGGAKPLDGTGNGAGSPNTKSSLAPVDGTLRKLEAKELCLQTNGETVLRFRLLAMTPFHDQQGASIRDSLLHPGDHLSVLVNPGDPETAVRVVLLDHGTAAERELAKKPVAVESVRAPEEKDLGKARTVAAQEAGPEELRSSAPAQKPESSDKQQALDKEKPIEKRGPVDENGEPVDSPVVVIHIADPYYSEEARKAKYQGTVLLRYVVDVDGKPKNIVVERSLGLGLDEKAIEAMRKWRFKPAMKNGKPVRMKAVTEMKFRLL